MTKPKRPRDPNQLAKLIVGIATGEVEEKQAADGKDPAAVSRGRKGGLIGGKAKMDKLTPKQKSDLGRKAALSRWGEGTPPSGGVPVGQLNKRS